MKHIAACALVAALLVLGTTAMAADATGVYVAPKFMGSDQHFEYSKVTTDYWGLPGFPMLPLTGTPKRREDGVLGGALAVGYDFFPRYALPLRAEVEYALRARSTVHYNGLTPVLPFNVDDTRQMSISTTFANVYYDLKTGTRFTPYIGGGVGLAFLHVKNTTADYFPPDTSVDQKNIVNFAWNIGAGLDYALDGNWSLDLGYRYCDFGRATGNVAKGNAFFFGGYWSYQAKSDVSAHEVALGLRYNF